ASAATTDSRQPGTPGGAVDVHERSTHTARIADAADHRERIGTWRSVRSAGGRRNARKIAGRPTDHATSVACGRRSAAVSLVESCRAKSRMVIAIREVAAIPSTGLDAPQGNSRR